MPCPWPRWWLVGLLANETSMPTWRLSLLSTLLNLCLSSLCALRSNSVRKACVNCSSIREDQFYIKYYLRLPLDGDCSWKIAKIGVLNFWNFPWKNSRQNERSSVLGSLNVNKVSQDFSWFFLCKIRLFVIFHKKNLVKMKVSRVFSCFFFFYVKFVFFIGNFQNAI